MWIDDQEPARLRPAWWIGSRVMSGRQERALVVEERCSLCGDAREQVGVLVEGFEGVYVCDDCIAVLTKLLDDARAESGAPHAAAA